LGGDENAAVHQCAAVLQAAAPGGQVSIINERYRGLRPRLDLIRTRSVKYAYLDRDGENVVLRLYAGDTLEQARVLYGEASRAHWALELRDQGWSVTPGFHFGFMERGMTWTTSTLNADDYVAYWVTRIGTTSVIPREDWDRELERLIADKIFDSRDEPQFDKDFRQTRRKGATPRPTLRLERAWPSSASRDDLTPRVRAALRQALLALDEPHTTISD
jgi:hypothetical protein